MTDGGIKMKINNNLNKSIFLFSILCISSFSNAKEIQDDELLKNFLKNNLKSQGFNENGTPKIVASDEINVSSELKNTWEKERKEMREKGYYTEKTERSYELLNFKNNLSMMLSISEKDKNPNSSRLRKSIDQINIAYESIPVKGFNNLGFGAYGGYVEGYTGFVQFFESTFSTCAYTENNVKISHGAVKISEDDATDIVNGKVTVINNKGEKGYGFLYQVDWYDENFFKTLECASESYSQEISDKTIELAKIIDSQS